MLWMVVMWKLVVGVLFSCVRVLVCRVCRCLV